MPLPLLAIGAAVGAGISMLSNYAQGRKQQKEIERQKEMEKTAYGYERDYADSQFSLQKGEALEGLGIARNRLAESFDADMKGFNLALQGQSLDNLQSRIALEDSAGMARAASAASGTRGNDNIEGRIALQNDLFSRQLDLQTQGNSLAVANMARSYSNTFADIGRETDSWGEGGWRTRAKGLEDAYAGQMHGLRMDGYDHAYTEAGPSVGGMIMAGFSGAMQGYSLGSSVSGYMDQMNTGTPLPKTAAISQQSPIKEDWQMEAYKWRNGIR